MAHEPLDIHCMLKWSVASQLDRVSAWYCTYSTRRPTWGPKGVRAPHGGRAAADQKYRALSRSHHVHKVFLSRTIALMCGSNRHACNSLMIFRFKWVFTQRHYLFEC